MTPPVGRGDRGNAETRESQRRRHPRRPLERRVPSRRGAGATTTGAAPEGERVQKILAQAGLGSRRACEDLIRAGQVTINGRVASLGDRADARRDSIKVAGKRIHLPEQHRYLLLNKPRGVVTTVSDPEGRRTVLDLVPQRMRRGLRPVGRLDYDTEGLLILTDDGDFNQRVAHPSHGSKKTYEVKVKGIPEDAELERLRRGIVLDGRPTAPAEIRPRGAVRRRRVEGSRTPPAPGRRPRPSRPGETAPRRSAPVNSWWIVRLSEGRTRQIREMFLRIGHPVQKLRRIAIGPLRDPGLPVGALRELTADEVRRLREPSRPGGPRAGGRRR